VGLDGEEEPGPQAQLEALARLARAGDGLVSGPELEALLPRYLVEPSATLPKEGA